MVFRSKINQKMCQKVFPLDMRTALIQILEVTLICLQRFIMEVHETYFKLLFNC